MRHMAILAGLALLVTTGCSDGGADADGDGTITAAEIDAEVAGAGDVTMRAGEWRQTVEFTEFDVPGVPAEMREMIAGQIGQGVSATRCLTEEEASRPAPDFFTEGQENCTYQEFDIAGNRMNLRMRCDGGEGGVATVAMQGEFEPESYAFEIDNQITGTPAGEITMKGTVSGERVGACP